MPEVVPDTPAITAPTAAGRSSALARIVWLAVLTFHGFGAVVWWWMMPGGFPLDHPRLWANRVGPVAVLAWVVAMFVCRARRRTKAFATLAIAFPAAWAAAAVAGKVAFPISGTKPALAALAGAALLAVGWVGTLRRDTAARSVVAVVAHLAGLVGAALPLTQRGGPPSTRPLAVAVANIEDDPASVTGVRAERFNASLMVQPSDGAVTCRFGGVMMTVHPLLTFISRSPDRCWTIFAPRSARVGPPRTPTARRRDGDRAAFAYLDDGETSLRVRALDDVGSASVEAVTRLPSNVYSHLNTFTEIGLYGHKHLFVSFSPCPDVKIEVTPSDYPVGRPQRCAYLGADGVFRVVEARSGEKGPFRELAAGPLARAEPLAITLHDGDAPVCRIVLDDWAAQAGTDLSPTAGWGLPVNAIEFSRYGDATSSPVGISITLAGTSVGRGWDSVGHAAGSYRNRLRVESLARAATRPANGG